MKRIFATFRACQLASLVWYSGTSTRLRPGRPGLRPLRFGCVLAASAAIFAGCGGLGAGGHATYRIGSNQTQFSGDCEGNDLGSTTTIRGGTTFFVFIVGSDAGDVPYLDVGGNVLEGVETEEGYDFSGTMIEVDEGGNTTITTQTDYDISLVLDGSSASGTSTTTSTSTCSGQNCDLVDNYSCVESSTFVGIELDEPVVVQPT